MKVKVRKKARPNANPLSENVTGDPPIKTWLEHNEIYFDTVLSVILTLAGIIISIATLIHGYQSSKDEAMLNMPMFNVARDIADGPIVVDGITVSTDKVTEYRIYNQGGELSTGRAIGARILTISMWEGDQNVAKVNFEVNDTFIRTVVRYNPSEKSFTFYQHIHDTDAGKMVKQIKELLIQDYPYHIEIFWIDYADITFSDYKGDRHRTLIDLYDGENVPVINKETDGYLIGFYSDGIVEIYEEIQTKLDHALTLYVNKP